MSVNKGESEWMSVIKSEGECGKEGLRNWLCEWVSE